ncbi:MAG: response regulator, partial [Bdellovibrionales bacterium]|nr:response regulator [Bdellovibrionales bacterium]
SNKFRWMQEEFDLNSLLEQIVERFSTEIRAKGSSFTLEVDDRYQRVVVTDPSYLYHILTLILSNSVAFTTDGDIRLIISSGQRAGRNIKFVIQDSGPMIHPDLAKDALSSFTSIGEDIHPRLQPDIFIANILLQQQGEELSFVPTSDDRNRCYFCFPAVAKDEVISDDSDESIEFEQSEPSSDQNDQQPIKRQKKTNPLVLIADDSLESQNMIELFLRRLSLEVNFAFNGQEALERCQLHKYDLIFMDMQMPVLDGLTATQQIRQYEVEQGQERTPIIAISAHIKPEEVSLLLKAGCDQCLVKPLQQKHLIKIVNVYCG